MLCAGNMAARHRNNSAFPVQPEPRKMPALQRGESGTALLLEVDSFRSNTRTAPLTTGKQPSEAGESRDGLLLPADSSVDFRSRLWKARSSGVY
jgi:hypothetical protein